MPSGYTHCPCRDCMELTISNDVLVPTLCEECRIHCDPDPRFHRTEECHAPGAYPEHSSARAELLRQLHSLSPKEQNEILSQLAEKEELS